ncbi:hypothetical protein B0H12DRAFT_622034 [Mycena haematopus]|nr:hypothetical protein B0H12DRAFT_622034 [Mycena haematopus]
MSVNASLPLEAAASLCPCFACLIHACYTFLLLLHLRLIISLSTTTLPPVYSSGDYLYYTRLEHSHIPFDFHIVFEHVACKSALEVENQQFRKLVCKVYPTFPFLFLAHWQAHSHIYMPSVFCGGEKPPILSCAHPHPQSAPSFHYRILQFNCLKAPTVNGQPIPRTPARAC